MSRRYIWNILLMYMEWAHVKVAVWCLECLYMLLSTKRKTKEMRLPIETNAQSVWRD